jgi:2-keto-myo-inositol isomerase
MGNGERQANLRLAMRELGPMLDEHGLIGLIEPLGFETCPTRFKSEVVDAIEALAAGGRFRIVHDTFHHCISGEPDLFASYTGMVHVSGVVAEGLDVRDMTDGHRILVDARDRLGNIDQLRALIADGYAGPISFEAFAAEVHDLVDPFTALATSTEFIRSHLAAEAA